MMMMMLMMFAGDMIMIGPILWVTTYEWFYGQVEFHATWPLF